MPNLGDPTALRMDAPKFSFHSYAKPLSELVDIKVAVYQEGSILAVAPKAVTFDSQDCFQKFTDALKDLTDALKDLPSLKALLIDLSYVPGNALMKFGEEMAAILTLINARQDGRLAVVLSQDNPFHEKLRTYGLLGSDFLRVRSSETEAMRATTGTEPQSPLNWQRAEDLLQSLQAQSDSRFNQKNLGDFSFQPKELLTTTIQKSDTTWIITPRGTMLSEERAGWDDFFQVLQEAKDHPAPLQVIIDFTFCPNLDSSAIGFLLSTQRGLRAFGHTLVLKNLSTEIQLKLQTKRLNRILTIK